MVETRTIKQFIRSKCRVLLHVLDLIREEKWCDDDIAETLIELFKQKKIVFAYEGTYIYGNPSKWTDDEWEEAQKRGTFLNRLLRGNYRQGFKKKELVSLRYIMRKIWKETNEYVQPSWGFFRIKLKEDGSW